MALPLSCRGGVCEAVRTEGSNSLAGSVQTVGKFDGRGEGLAEPTGRMGTLRLCCCSRVADLVGWGKRVSKHGLTCGLSKHCFGVTVIDCSLLCCKPRCGLLPTQRVTGVAAGAYFRVGYKAAGDPSDLVQLCSELDLQNFIVNSLRDKSEESTCRISDRSREFSKGQLSPGLGNLAGGIVALGKFDALHIGHRALAEQAAKMGTPYLLSFSGMAEILGWEKRLPLVATCDRERVISLWSEQCGGALVQEVSLQFGKVRSLSPREFLEKLAYGLQVKGVVAGSNYRFGYKAAGDASDLVQLSSELGLQSYIVDAVMDKSEGSACELSEKSREKGQVSSTRVRQALAAGHIRAVTELLGRLHRLVIKTENSIIEHCELRLPLGAALNQYPKDGCYACDVILGDGTTVNGSSPGKRIPGQVKIRSDSFVVSLTEGDIGEFDLLQNNVVNLELLP